MWDSVWDSVWDTVWDSALETERVAVSVAVSVAALVVVWGFQTAYQMELSRVLSLDKIQLLDHSFESIRDKYHNSKVIPHKNEGI